MHRTVILALLALIAGGVAAQQKTRPDPADPSARSPSPAYTSAFEAYRPYVAPALAPWRETNGEMGRLGGHSGHVAGSAPARGPAATAPKPPSQGERK